jgi:hypothetical protein
MRSLIKLHGLFGNAPAHLDFLMELKRAESLALRDRGERTGKTVLRQASFDSEAKTEIFTLRGSLQNSFSQGQTARPQELINQSLTTLKGSKCRRLNQRELSGRKRGRQSPE